MNAETKNPTVRKGKNLIIALVLGAIAVVAYTAFFLRVKYGPF